MQITPAVIDAIFYNFSTVYQAAYDRIEPWYNKVSTEVPSTARENRYAWMRLLPRMRQWIGERKYLNIEAAAYTLANQDYELTVEVDRNDIMDDQLGVYGPTMSMMGEQAKRWGDDLVLSLLQNGSTNVAFDGQPFFSASHPTGQPGSSATYSNYTASGLALNAANYQTVRQTMLSYVGEDGKPLQIRPNLLVVPPQLESQARVILNADFIAPATAFGGNAASQMQSNVLKSSAELLVLPDLSTNATQWFLMDTTKPIKPFVFQLRKAPTMVPLTDPQSEPLFKRRKFVFGIDARGNAGYTLPFLCYAASA
jgi:phage major head subunit gpT-like protein